MKPTPDGYPYLDFSGLTRDQTAALAQQAAIRSMTEEQLQKFRQEWSWWARDEQKPPPGDWRVWLYLAHPRAHQAADRCQSAADEAPRRSGPRT